MYCIVDPLMWEGLTCSLNQVHVIHIDVFIEIISGVILKDIYSVHVFQEFIHYKPYNMSVVFPEFNLYPVSIEF